MSEQLRDRQSSKIIAGLTAKAAKAQMEAERLRAAIELHEARTRDHACGSWTDFDFKLWETLK